MNEQIKEIIKKAKDGDSTAIGRLYEENRPTGLLIAWKYVKNQDDAEDMYQDAFLKAITNIDRFDETKDFGPWLNTIIANTCKNYLVKRRAINFSEMSDEENEFVDTLDSKDNESMPELSYDRKEFMEIMDSLISELPQAQKEAVALFYYKEMSVKEIARLQDVSEDTVKSRLNYSRKKVGAAVEEYEKKTGIKLHGVIIIPLMFTLFYRKSVYAAEAETFLSAISKGVTAATTGAAGTTAAIKSVSTGKAVSTGAKKAASLGVKNAIKATAVKIAIPVAATAVIGGSAYAVLKPDPAPMAEEVRKAPERDALDNLFEELGGDESLCIDVIGRLNDINANEDGSYRVSLDHIYLWYKALDENGSLVNMSEEYKDVFDRYSIPLVTEWELNESSPPTVYYYMGEGTFDLTVSSGAVLKHIDSWVEDDYYATEKLSLGEVSRTGIDNYRFYNEDRLVVIFSNNTWPVSLIEELPYVKEVISFVSSESGNNHEVIQDYDKKEENYPSDEGDGYVDDLRYELDDGTLTISGKGVLFTVDPTIVEALENFHGGKRIKRLVINDGVIPGEMLDFHGITKHIESVRLPSGIKMINKKMFEGCKDLTQVIIPKGVTIIGYGAFDHCESLRSVEIPDTVTRIDERAFADCKSLEYITIPDSVTEIPKSCFEFCTDLKGVKLGDRTTKISSGAFRYCKKLVSISFPESLQEIGPSAFDYCDAYEGRTVP